MDKCGRCSSKSAFVVRCGHGITCYTYGVCGSHLAWAVRRIIKEDPTSNGVRVDKED